MTRNQRINAAMTPERISALREFKRIFGDRWQRVMRDFHEGRPHHEGMHLLASIRQIRNSATGNPGDLVRFL